MPTFFIFIIFLFQQPRPQKPRTRTQQAPRFGATHPATLQPCLVCLAATPPPASAFELFPHQQAQLRATPRQRSKNETDFVFAPLLKGASATTFRTTWTAVGFYFLQEAAWLRLSISIYHFFVLSTSLFSPPNLTQWKTYPIYRRTKVIHTRSRSTHNIPYLPSLPVT